MKTQGSTLGLLWKLQIWSAGEVSGIPSVAVKCVDIRRNTSGEGGLLDEPILLAIPYSMVMAKLGLVNTRIGLIIVYLSFSVPYAVWMLVGFFKIGRAHV